MRDVHTSAFTRAYIECALWSSTDDTGDPLDANYDIHDLAPEAVDAMCADCEDFMRSYRDLYLSAGWTDSQAGHDFWLARNYHGSGFWDRVLGLGAVGEGLTEAARSYGSVDLYVGDDGLIYHA